MREFTVTVAGQELVVKQNDNGKFVLPEAVKRWRGYGTSLKPCYVPIILAMKPLAGTFAENALTHGVAGLAIDASRIGHSDPQKLTVRTSDKFSGTDFNSGKVGHFRTETETASADPAGRWPANLLLDEEAATQLDEPRMGVDGVRENSLCGDFGGPSRFFYCGKASPRERGNGNNHPCCKPLALTEYLARLILPPARDNSQRSLLVPYSGSGSEAIGAVRAGWEFVYGIDNDAAYVEIARGRVAQEQAQTQAVSV